MGPIARVFHHSAKPVSLLEFTDALQATCPRLHPRARHSRHRTIGLATSGGVDSMALAYLFSLLRTQNPTFLIGDSPCSDVTAMVIDHKLRPNSAQEARAVVAELGKMRHISPRVLELNWGDVDPLTLTNLETAARRLRYRLLGETCAWGNIDNLFLGHHADDMHETVLMRLLGGHPARGLAGMRRSNDIPECYDMHGAYQSGFVDQMAGKRPPLTYNIRRKEAHGLRRDLLSDMRPQLRVPIDDRLSYLDVKPRPPPEDHENYTYEEGYDDLIEEWGGETPRSKEKPELDQLDTEDGGVRICRPLLDFEKDRLIATCEQNGITWFEDPTNADPGLTTRNAVRHLVRNHELPEALRRPAILRLAERVRERVQGEEEEARQLLLERTNVLDFRTNAGTLEVEFPDLHPGEDLERNRTVAALLVRRIIEVVSPETHSPALPSLQGTVSRLFPRLATPAHPTSQPASFNIASVLLSRLPDGSSSSSSGAGAARWLLSRAPYPAPNPLPEAHYFQAKGFPHHGHGVVRMKPRWTYVRKKWRLFDGRFWVLLRLRIPGRFTVAPFRPEHSKAFKAALGREERERLEALLVGHAPGKVRYTLPAVYYDGVVDLEGDGGGTVPGRGGLGMMVALPSLGVHLPGLEKLMTYEVRYKKVDREILEKCHMSVL
ncbi:uncharacterized protein DNG_07984 [Cephalotrichum gorgonifer]|uniref:tRNA(Ile)-lysidine synthetase n=1 Tax=Cephalotrichum gorgonifer TaxID=2041049 RepID=A0AAE8SYR5_9PEZI|nr:uncharacterized protein DNG_07984 [Cephalotrichum gorgonifer]